MKDNTLITSRQLRELIPVSEMTIWRWEKHGDFPKRIKINNRNYWQKVPVLGWIENKASGETEEAETQAALEVGREG